jgi:hypothetical protein
MDLVQTVRKEGSRYVSHHQPSPDITNTLCSGGRADFKWEDVKNDSHRENYLGHSLMARTSLSPLTFIPALLLLSPILPLPFLNHAFTNQSQPWAAGKKAAT